MAMIAPSWCRMYARRSDSGLGPETASELVCPSGKSESGPMSTHRQSSSLSESAAAKPMTGTRMAAVITPPVTSAMPVRNLVRVT
jgi:hypothetical protein